MIGVRQQFQSTVVMTHSKMTQMTHNSQHRTVVESGKFVSTEQLNENNNLKTKQSNYQNKEQQNYLK